MLTLLIVASVSPWGGLADGVMAVLGILFASAALPLLAGGVAALRAGRWRSHVFWVSAAAGNVSLALACGEISLLLPHYVSGSIPGVVILGAPCATAVLLAIVTVGVAWLLVRGDRDAYES
jgi:hypothetical protein